MPRVPLCTAALLAAILLNADHKVIADVIFSDGGNHIVNSVVNDFIEVRNGAGGIATTVTFQAGADIRGTDNFDDTVYVLQNSVVNIEAGRFVDDVSAYNRGQLNITGGDFLDDVYAANRATVRLSGGIITDDLEADDNSLIVMTGGSVGEDVESFGGTIIISGGTFAASSTSLDSGLGVSLGGTIELIGSNFRLNGNAIDSGSLTQISGLLSGTLADGSTFTDIPFTRNLLGNGNLGALTVTAIPEPATVLLLSVCCATLLTMRLRKKDSSQHGSA